MIDKDKDFNIWLEQFIKESGHNFVTGFFIETIKGEMFYNGTDEYKSWYDNKLKEYDYEIK